MPGGDVRNLTAAVRRDLAALRRRDAASLRQVRRRYSEALKGEPPAHVLRFVRELLAGAGWAERVVACETLGCHPGAFGLLNDGVVEEMATGLSDWGSVD